MDTLGANGILRLTPPERLALISELWDSLGDEQLPLSAPQTEELDRRLATLAEDRCNGIGWDAAKVELIRRCP